MKGFFIISVLLVIIAALLSNEVMNALLMFLLAGSIPGTSYSVPYWFMMALYCTVIALLVAHYIERVIAHRHTRISARTAKHMPKRRYSHI
jgi:hypothetical protein